ncbi:MAG TPA: response regulator [Candidatus Methylomirabilis sp.]|nr:response regulator [Candidatus Methylomirabilis sp.]
MPKMLVVDDDPAWRALYRMTFDGHFEIVEASDGQEGLDALETCNPDVIVLDLRMPRMDGLDFIRRLGRKQVRGAIVVCSGVLQDADRPQIPGVQMTPKSPDLRDLWSALISAMPDLGWPSAPIKESPSPTGTFFWRD